MELIAAIAVLAAVVLAVMLARKGSSAAEVQTLRNELNLLRQSSEKSIQNMGAIFAGQTQAINASLQSALAGVTAEVGARLDAVNQHVSARLNENVVALQASSKDVNDRILSVQGTFAGLQKQVGEITEQARQLGEVSRSISALERVLSAPKLRGGFGETQLENLLAEVFPREHYSMQYRFPSGDAADAVLFFPQGMVAIDSKFSLENFRRIAEADSESGGKTARREFLKDVRRRIDEVASKYIRPADGTLPFALMYIPAENVYYEAIIRDEDGNDVYQHCIQKRVIPVSPNSLYAYLQTIMVGLNSLRISQRAEAVLREIESLKIELEKFDKVFGILGNHLRNASRSYEDSARELGKLEDRVESLSNGGVEQKELFADDKPRIVESPRALAAGED
ncbi:MAG: DNA recombination protein RmuC [Acidobacteriales bacterium]|nr:DNA recombination protein RmuC [Terriglobales bacterium]